MATFLSTAGPHLTHDSYGPSQPIDQTASRLVQRFLQCSLVWQTDRPTHHATRSVTIGRIYVRSTAMRPNNNRPITCIFLLYPYFRVGDVFYVNITGNNAYLYLRVYCNTVYAKLHAAHLQSLCHSFLNTRCIIILFAKFQLVIGTINKYEWIKV